MSTSTREAHELLRLFKCVVDTGTDVLAAFAKVKLLPTFNGNFKLFLDDKKHEIFHMWQSKKLSCCECPPVGYNFKRKSHIHNWIFQKIYDDSGLEEKRHIVRNSGKVVQVCLHKYVSRNIAIDELDISIISFLLRDLAVLSQNENTSLDTITTTRNQICHAYSMNCIPLIFLNTAWTALEHALVDLADPSYKAMTRKHIKYLRKVDLEKEEITELLKDVNEINSVLHELSEMQITNNNLIRNGFKTHESRIVEVKDELIQNQNMQFAEIREQIQELTAIVKVSLKQKTRRTVTQYSTSAEKKGQSDTDMTDVGQCCTEVYVKQGATPKRQNRENFKTLLSRWSTQSETDMADVSKCSTEVSAKQGAIPKRHHRDESYTEKFKKLLFRWSMQAETDMAHADKRDTEVSAKQGATPKKHHRDETEKVKENTAFHIKKKSTRIEGNDIEEKEDEESSKQNRQSEDICQVHATCQVEGKDIDESAAVQSLSDIKNESPLNLDFNITSAERKCIFLEMEIPTKVLEDKQLFRVALRALIVKIARAGKVDFNKESTITLHLTFNDDLTEDIIKEIYEFANNSDILGRRLRSDQQSSNVYWLRLRCDWLEDEIVTLRTENSQLYKETVVQREEITNLEMEVKNYKRKVVRMIEELESFEEELSRMLYTGAGKSNIDMYDDDNWKNTRDSGYSDHMSEIQHPTIHGTSKSKPERNNKSRSRPPSLVASTLAFLSEQKDGLEALIRALSQSQAFYTKHKNFTVPNAANMENITAFQPNLAMHASFNRHDALHSHDKISPSDNGSPLPPRLKKPPPPSPSDTKHRRNKSEPFPAEVIHSRSISDPPPSPPSPELRKTIALSSNVGWEKAIRWSTYDVTPSPRRRAKSNSDDSKSSGKETPSLPFPRKKKSPVGQKFEALFDCDADNDDELTFAEGEIILVLREEGDDMLEGTIEGHPERRGLFPKTFVQPLS